MNTNKIQKRHVAVLIPYYYKEKEVYAFLQKRSVDAKRLPGYFGFFGGGLDGGESPEEALKREIKEELDINISNYSYFNLYEFYGSILDVYTMEVEENFSETIVVKEGDFGKFFSEADILDENKITQNDKLILVNFFGKIKHDDPFHS